MALQENSLNHGRVNKISPPNKKSIKKDRNSSQNKSQPKLKPLV